jgi:hypothetical protein
VDHRDTAALEDGLTEILRAPTDGGAVELIVRRPAVGEREVLAQAVLDPTMGLVGDTWSERSSRRTPDGSPHIGMQLTLMGSRVIALLARDRERWPLAGDQLYVDLDLGVVNLPIGTWLAVGDAVVEVSDQPHTGCAQFRDRFGADAMRFVNTPAGRDLRLRGLNTFVVAAGTVRVGDVVRKLER